MWHHTFVDLVLLSTADDTDIARSIRIKVPMTDKSSCIATFTPFANRYASTEDRSCVQSDAHGDAQRAYT